MFIIRLGLSYSVVMLRIHSYFFGINTVFPHLREKLLISSLLSSLDNDVFNPVDTCREWIEYVHTCT